MMYSEEDIQRRLRIAEDSRWEFKQIKFSDNNSPKSPSRDDMELCSNLVFGSF